MTGLSLVLAIVGWLVLVIVVVLPLCRRLQRADADVARIEEQAEARATLGSLLPEHQPPPCLRELDPSGVPFDWSRYEGA